MPSNARKNAEFLAGEISALKYDVVAGGGGSQYIIQGWMRMTVGSAHALNTDWREMRTLTGT